MENNNVIESAQLEMMDNFLAALEPMIEIRNWTEGEYLTAFLLTCEAADIDADVALAFWSELE
mgnify:FL=1